jgi:hypothetical protein
VPTVFTSRFCNRQFDTPAPPEPTKPELPPLDGISDYNDFKRRLDERRRELGLTILEVDERASFQDGYTSKILNKAHKPRGHFRNIGSETMGRLLDALEVTLTLERWR